MSIRLATNALLHIGETGYTLTAMSPQGKIAVGGRTYDARSDCFWIDANVRVVVVHGDHLGLIVRRLDGGRLPKLTDHGRPTSQAVWQRPAAEAATPSRQRLNPLARLGAGLRESASLGALYGLLCVCCGFAEVEVGSLFGPWLWVAWASVCGAVWGALLFLFFQAVLRDLGEFEQLTLVTLCLALFGSTGGTVAGYSLWGLVGGLTGAVLGAACLGLLVPMLLVMGQAMAGPTEGE